MKRAITFFLAIGLILSVVSCNNTTNNSGEDVVTNDSIGIKTEAIAGNNDKTDKDKPLCKEDEILFAALDRADIDGYDDKIYYFNYKGEVLTQYTSLYTGGFADSGLAPAVEQNSGKVGFVDERGVFVIYPQYDEVLGFSQDGIAAVSYKGKWGYIDTDGREVIPFIYDSAKSFNDIGYAIVSSYPEGIPGVIDKKGNVILGLNYEESYPGIVGVYDGYILCGDPGKLYGGAAIVDFDGNVLDKIEIAEDEKDTEVYYTDGKKIWKRTIQYYSDTELYSVYKEEVFDGKKFTKVEKEYDIVSENVSTTITGRGYGVVKNGKPVIPCEYDGIYEEQEFFIAYKRINKDDARYYFDIYDSKFNLTADHINYSCLSDFWISDFKYNLIIAIDDPLPAGYFRIVTVDRNCDLLNGIIDYTGKIIVEPVFYDEIKCFIE